jgi:N-dimethylarginine dimethylaminohydrolase
MKGLHGLTNPVRQLRPASHDKGLTSLPVAEDVRVARSRLLMAEPDGFRLSGEINAWMRRTRQPHAAKALAQWRGLHATLRRLGITIDVLRQPTDWPDAVFTANAGLAATVNGTPVFIPSQFKHPERQGEHTFFERAFLKRGYRVAHLFDADETWEGEGDMLEHHGVLFGGYGWRSRVTAHQKVANFLGMDLITLHLVRPHFYHLDTALAFLDERTVLYYPGAFEPESRLALERHVASIPDGALIAVSTEDAARFACNTIPVGRTLVMNEVSDALVETLARRHFRVLRLPLWEFLKSGGAAKCLVQWLPAFQLALNAPLRTLAR